MDYLRDKPALGVRFRRRLRLGPGRRMAGDVPAVSVEDTYRGELARKSASTLSQMMGRMSQRGVEVLREYTGLG